jgi:hypothetical protein
LIGLRMADSLQYEDIKKAPPMWGKSPGMRFHIPGLVPA